MKIRKIEKKGLTIEIGTGLVFVTWSIFLPDVFRSSPILQDISTGAWFYSINEFRLTRKYFPSVPEDRVMGINNAGLFSMILPKYVIGGETIVVLSNIDLSAKPLEFWKRMSKSRVKTFGTFDNVVLICNSYEEASQLLDNIPVSFADARLISINKKGKTVSWNMEE